MASKPGGMFKYDPIEQLHADLSGHLDQIKRLFKASAQPRVTLVIRNIGLDDGDVVVGDDDFDAAIETIQKRKAGDPWDAARQSPAQDTATQGGGQ